MSGFGKDNLGPLERLSVWPGNASGSSQKKSEEKCGRSVRGQVSLDMSAQTAASVVFIIKRMKMVGLSERNA